MSRSFFFTAFSRERGWPNIARIPSRIAPSQPRPESRRTTSEIKPVMVSALGVGRREGSMIPSGWAASLTTPGKVLETESTTLR